MPSARPKIPLGSPLCMTQHPIRSCTGRIQCDFGSSTRMKRKRKNITILGPTGKDLTLMVQQDSKLLDPATMIHLQFWVPLGQDSTLMVPAGPNAIRSWLLQRPNNPVWLTNNREDNRPPPHRRYSVYLVWLRIDTFWCSGFGLSTRPNNAGSGYQSQIQRLVAEKATPPIAIVD